MAKRTGWKRICAIAVLVAASCHWWVDGTTNPESDLIFLPSGDVAYGFRSFGSRLEWVQYASWQHHDPYYPEWSLPWWPIVAAEVVALLFAIGALAAALKSRTKP
jgi:hypothetical protein